MLRAISYLVSSQVLVMAAGVLAEALVNRGLGPAGRGDYAELSAWIAISAAVAGLSAPIAVYHYADTRFDHPRARLAGSLGMLWMALVVGLALAGAFLVGGDWPFVSDNLARHAGAVYAAVCGAIAVAYLTALLTVAAAFRVLALVPVAQAVVFALAVLALYGVHRMSVATVVASFAAATCAAAGVYLYVVGRRLPGWWPPRVDVALAGRMAGAGLKVHVATVATILYVMFDQVMLYEMAGREPTGLYGVAVTLVMALMVLPMSVQRVLYSRLAATDAGGADAELTMRVTRCTVYVFAFALVLVAVLSGPLIALFAGPRFEAAVPLLRTLLPGVWLFAIPNLLSPYWVKQGRFVLASFTGIALVALNLALNWFWIPRFGAVGAAWATNLTYAAGAAVSLWMFGWLSGRNALAMFVPRRADWHALVALARREGA